MPKATRESDPLLHLLFYVATIAILLLSAFNLEDYLKPNEVLGVETENEELTKEKDFWEGFMVKNPNYIPGWIELGREDKVDEIDPNFKP